VTGKGVTDIENGGLMKSRFLRPVVLLACAAFALSPFTGSAQTAGVSIPQPTGFRGIALGMDIDSVKARLGADPFLVYRGEPDVSLLPQSEQTLIECKGTSFIRRAYFQFEKSRLFIMIFVLDTERLDYYSVFTALSRKYGGPSSLDPGQAIWLFDSVRFSLERPLTVKYVEKSTFESLLKKGSAQADLDQLSREKFLEQF
jgi:hypothetical protein